MKLRSFVYNLSYSACILSWFILYSKDIEKTVINQQLPLRTTDILEQFSQPIYFTRSSVKRFIKHTYNHSAYAQRFLPFSFSHIITLLEYNCQSSQPRAYIKSILRLFTQKIKSTQYINSYAFLELLSHIPELTQPCFSQETEKNNKKETIKQCIYDFLLSEFKQLKENPEDALELLSDKLYTRICNSTNCSEQDISVQELQYALEQFLDINLQKLIWSPLEQNHVWESVRALGQQLEELYNMRILTAIESLDSLYWTLICRFCYFLELACTELQQECYMQIKQDLQTQQDTLWTLKEQEAFVTPKLRYLQKVIVIAEAKSQAYAAGLISNYPTVT